jgi:hypothetical protein
MAFTYAAELPMIHTAGGSQRKAWKRNGPENIIAAS